MCHASELLQFAEAAVSWWNVVLSFGNKGMKLATARLVVVYFVLLQRGRVTGLVIDFCTDLE